MKGKKEGGGGGGGGRGLEPSPHRDAGKATCGGASGTRWAGDEHVIGVMANAKFLRLCVLAPAWRFLGTACYIITISFVRLCGLVPAWRPLCSGTGPTRFPEYFVLILSPFCPALPLVFAPPTTKQQTPPPPLICNQNSHNSFHSNITINSAETLYKSTWPTSSHSSPRTVSRSNSTLPYATSSFPRTPSNSQPRAISSPTSMSFATTPKSKKSG